MTDKKMREPDEIVAWLVTEISKLVGTPREELDLDEPIANYLTDSRDALSLAADLQDWLGTEISVYIVWDHPTIGALAEHISTEVLRPAAR